MHRTLFTWMAFLPVCLAQTTPEAAALYATQAKGMSLSATAAERTAMHRATASLIASALEQKNFLLAASTLR